MKANDPAFPLVYKDVSDVLKVHLGISQRDLIAAVVAGGIAANRVLPYADYADAAYKLADAIITKSSSKP